MNGRDNEDCSLVWSLDPMQSWLADWKIKINSRQVYHVHRTVLVSGNAKSSYFIRLFCNETFVETRHCTSEVQMNEPAAEAFTILLNCLYEQDIDHQINIENIKAVMQLGDYFGVDCLNQLGARKLSDWVVTRQLSNNQCLDLFGPTLLSQVLKVTEKKHMFRLGWLIANVCWSNKDELDCDLFQELTKADHLPVDGLWELLSAIKLLQVEQHLLAGSKTAEQREDLQDRCIRAIARKWCQLNIRCLLSTTLPVDSLVLAKIWEKTLEKATESKPHTITLRDAGTSEVNGTYFRFNDAEGFQSFFRCGVWKNMRSIFVVVGLQNDAGWDISVEIPANDLKDENCEDFYAFRGRGFDVPPTTGWRTLRGGTLPVPTLTYDDTNGNGQELDE